jgi:hypothetical protein
MKLDSSNVNDNDTEIGPYTTDVDTVCGHLQLEQHTHQQSSTARKHAYDITSILKKHNINQMDFPYRQEQAVHEFDNEPIFCKAFPWLFPGGVGDITQKSDEFIDISKWMRKLMLYEDGRFAEDKMFCFFVLNYYQRHQNNVQGAFYVTHFDKNGPQNIQDLKDEIQKGKTFWIDKLLYFGSKVTGSPSYWRERRQEVYSWINYHLSEGNGPPTFFLTLSCAEYHWPDVARLLKERIDMIEKKKLQHSKEYRHLLSDFTIVVQQYFQKRVSIWIETVGNEIYGIDHYWLRYEFAPGRGQIHAHMLAISKHGTEIRARLRDLRQQYQDDDQKQVSFIANYLQEKFGFIADVKTIDNLFVKTATVQPQENFINTSHCNINTPKRLTRNRKNEGE